MSGSQFLKHKSRVGVKKIFATQRKIGRFSRHSVKETQLLAVEADFYRFGAPRFRIIYSAGRQKLMIYNWNNVALFRSAAIVPRSNVHLRSINHSLLRWFLKADIV